VYSGNGIRPPKYGFDTVPVGEWVYERDSGGLFAVTGFSFPMYVEVTLLDGGPIGEVVRGQVSENIRPRSVTKDPCVTPEVVPPRAGLMPSEMKRLRQLEDENARLKRVVADLSLDKEMLQDVIKRKL
jgi:hypothetical protein